VIWVALILAAVHRRAGLGLSDIVVDSFYFCIVTTIIHYCVGFCNGFCEIFSISLWCLRLQIACVGVRGTAVPRPRLAFGKARRTYAVCDGSGVRTERWGTMLAARFPTSQTLRPPWLSRYEKLYARVARSVCTAEARFRLRRRFVCVPLRTAFASLADVRKGLSQGA